LNRTIYALVGCVCLAACGAADDHELAGHSGAPAPSTDAPKTEPKPGSTTAPKNAFDGAPAYVATLGATTRQPSHPFVDKNPVGRPCLSCHDGSGAPPRFAAGGTVYDGETPAARVEVRVVGADGVARSTYTDDDGNFFFLNSTSPLAFPAMVGVRDATRTRLMQGTPPNGNCNDCHNGGGAAGPLHVDKP